MDANFERFIDATCRLEEAIEGFLSEGRKADLTNEELLLRLEDAVANADSSLKVTITED